MQYYAIYSPAINDIVGKCSEEGIDDLDDYTLEHDGFIKISEEEFEDDELEYSDIQGRMWTKAISSRIIKLEEG